MTERNIWHEGVWYGPDYPDAGDPPAGATFEKAGPDDVDDGDFVGHKAVTEPSEAAQFGQPVPIGDPDGGDKPAGEVEPVGTKAAETDAEAAAFRGEPARESSSTDDDEGKPRARQSRRVTGK